MKLNNDDIRIALLNATHDMHGLRGAGLIEQGFKAQYINRHTGVSLVRVRRGPHEFVRSSLHLVKVIGDHRVKSEIIYVGATLRHCYKRIKLYQQRWLEQKIKDSSSEAERKKLQEI